MLYMYAPHKEGNSLFLGAPGTACSYAVDMQIKENASFVLPQCDGIAVKKLLARGPTLAWLFMLGAYFVMPHLVSPCGRSGSSDFHCACLFISEAG